MANYQYGLQDLKACLNLSDLAKLLGVEPKFLSKQIYHVDDGDKYHIFSILKKGGTERTIHSPNSKLKFVQSRLSRLLYQCYFDLYGKPEKPERVLSHGFQRKRGLSIYSNANRHIKKRFVFNVDIENFFSSFNFGRVRGYFIKNNNFLLTDTVATVIAQTACFNNSLPQGAPSSPIITEFISQALDYRLQSVARRHRCTYSRYVDDITFSTNLKDFPSKVGYSGLLSGVWEAGTDLEKEVIKCGFVLKPKKVRMQQAHQRQATTSLTVNEKVNIGSYYYKGARWCAHAMMTTGKAKAPSASLLSGMSLTPNQILGMLSHVHNIKKHELEYASIRGYTKHNKTAPHYLRLLGDFYHYGRLHINPRPVIICEGKTDYIYLKEAIRWNVSDPRISQMLIDPQKINSTNKSDNHWRVDFLKPTDYTEALLSFVGGVGDLIGFAEWHLSRTKKFHAHPSKCPVIIVVDNDDEGTKMWSYIKKTTKYSGTIDGAEPYYHVGANLYVVPIPSAGKDDFFIEKLFPKQWLDMKIDEKKFGMKKKLGADEYSKTDFAEKVIRANRGKVDLSSFLPLLNTVCDIIEGK